MIKTSLWDSDKDITIIQHKADTTCFYKYTTFSPMMFSSFVLVVNAKLLMLLPYRPTNIIVYCKCNYISLYNNLPLNKVYTNKICFDILSYQTYGAKGPDTTMILNSLPQHQWPPGCPSEGAIVQDPAPTSPCRKPRRNRHGVRTN